MFSHDTKLRDIDFFSFPYNGEMVESRIENCFSAVGIETVGDLIDRSKGFCRIRNLGITSLRAISRRCKELSIPLPRPFDELEGIKNIWRLEKIKSRITAT